jgi:raffinose synthase
LLSITVTSGIVKECVVTRGAGSKAMALRVHGSWVWLVQRLLFTREPARCLLNSVEVEFSYDADIDLVFIHMPMLEQERYRWTLEIVV